MAFSVALKIIATIMAIVSLRFLEFLSAFLRFPFVFALHIHPAYRH